MSQYLKGTRAAWHLPGMRVVLCLPLFFSLGLWADEAGDRADIDRVIAALNDPGQRAGLFSKDADIGVDFDRLVNLHRRAASCSGNVIGRNEPWTKLTVPRVVSGDIRFVTPDVAIVDGASVVEGAATLSRRAPLLFVMRREGAEWRVAAVRVLAADPVKPPVI